MIATLPMYDRAETAAHNNKFWLAIKKALGFGPDRLSRTEDLWSLWQNEDLVFAQTCGLPYRKYLFDKVHYVATPDYGLHGCPPGYYNSLFISYENQELSKAAQGTFAFNETLSQSGWAGPMCHLDTLNLSPKAVVKTGSHVNSARAVAEKQADFAAIDAQSWRMIQTHDPFAKSLLVIGETAPVPGLPFICGKKLDPDAVCAAIETAILNLEEKTREALSLKGVVRIDPQRYLEMPTPRRGFE